MGLGFDTQLSSGGPAGCFIYYVSGMPWACCTSAEGVTAIEAAGAAFKRKLFGAQVCQMTPDVYPADDVTIVPNLGLDLGAQTIKYNEDKGLSVGGWSVEIGRVPPGTTFSDYYGGDAYGLIGLDVLPRYDDVNVKRARLSEQYPGTSTANQLKIDSNEGLAELIAANATLDKFTPLYIGNECLGGWHKFSGPDAAGEYVILAEPSVWRTPHEIHFVEDFENTNLLVTNVPLYGVVGRPAYLYWIQLDNGAVADTTSEPIIFRDGSVNTNPTGKPGDWKISHKGFTDYLNCEIPAKRFEGSLSGFAFSRTSSTDYPKQPAHFIIDEAKSTTTPFAPNRANIWLCAAGDSVFFETRQDVLDALHVELNLMHSGAPAYSTGTMNNQYFLDPELGEISFETDTAAGTNHARVGGAVALALGIGYLQTSDRSDFESEIKGCWPGYVRRKTLEEGPAIFDYVARHPQLLLWNRTEGNAQFYSADKNVDRPPLENNPGKCDYFYQSNWEDDEFEELYTTVENSWTAFYSVPDCGTGAGHALRVVGDADTLTFLDGTIISLGDPDSFENLGGRVEGGPLYLEGEINAINSGYVDIDHITPPDPWGENETSPKLWASTQTPLMRGSCLYYSPQVHDKDPWVVRDAGRIQSDSPSKLLRGILGTATLASVVGKRAQITHIPDVVGRSVDDRERIDWVRFEELTQGVIPDVSFSIELNKKLKLKDAIRCLCFTFGIHATWEYSESQRAWWISFAPMAGLSIYDAQLHGRVVDESCVIGNPPTDVLGDTWLYSELDYKGQCPLGEINYPVSSKIGAAQSIRGAKTLKVKDQVTILPAQVMDPFSTFGREFAQYLGGLLAEISYPQPNQKIQTTINPLARLAVGREVLLTWRALADTTTAKRGLTNHPALLTALTVIINGEDSKLGLTVRLANKAHTTWSPSIFFTGAANCTLVGSALSLSALSTDPTANKFGDPALAMTDLEYFDCLFIDANGDVTAKTWCSCSDYRVEIWQRGQDAHYASGGSQNLWKGTISSVNGSAGTATVTLDDTTNFSDSANDYVMFFARRTDSGLQPCQTEGGGYGYLGDSDGLVQDSAATNYRAITVGI